MSQAGLPGDWQPDSLQCLSTQPQKTFLHRVLVWDVEIRVFFIKLSSQTQIGKTIQRMKERIIKRVTFTSFIMFPRVIKVHWSHFGKLAEIECQNNCEKFSYWIQRNMWYWKHGSKAEQISCHERHFLLMFVVVLRAMDYLTTNTKEVVDFILEFQRRRVIWLKLEQELLQCHKWFIFSPGSCPL